MLKGIAVSEGIGIGSAHWLSQPIPLGEAKDNEQGEMALQLFHTLVEQVKHDIKQIIERKAGTVEGGIMEVFQAHLMILEDPMFAVRIEERIGSGLTVGRAVMETEQELTALFMSLDDPYMQERAADIKDVSKRILLKLNQGAVVENEGMVNRDYVLVTPELTPSDVLEIDTQHVKGILMSTGGTTAHAAIIACSLGIPAISGIDEETLRSVQEGDILVVDAEQGEVWINPAESLVQEYEKKVADRAKRQLDLERFSAVKAVTRDRKRIEVAINIGNPAEADHVARLGADGIGLFRTELFYANRTDWPSEEEQFLVYREVLEKAQGNPVVVRTLDVGGDKGLAYLTLKPEENPFLGLRAIRLCLRYPEIFRTQLRALLRASTFGRLRIMFPMISGWEELAEAKKILSETAEALRSEGYQISPDIQVGIMIEIPSAALQAEVLAQEVDFFSIGTNDLVQYTLAVDRSNEQVNYLYDYFHPAVLRLIKMTVEAAHKEGKWVGMCGEMAGDPLAIPLLAVIGLDELSMGSQRVLDAKKVVLESETANLQLWEEVLRARTADEVRRMLTKVQV